MWRSDGFGCDGSLGSMPSHQAVVNGAEQAALVQTMVLTPERIAIPTRRSSWTRSPGVALGVLAADSDEPRAGLCRDAGLCGWRSQIEAWAEAAEPEAELATASLAELAWAGRRPGASLPDGWGTSSAIDGALGVTMPAPWPIELVGGRPTLGHQLTRVADLKLRLAEFLVDRQLPASLARSLASAALQDFIDEVEPAYPDDWLTYVGQARSLSAERVDDYVSALAVPGGPLVPADRAGVAP